MKKIYTYCKQFIQEEYNLGYFLSTFILLFSLIYFNYSTDFERHIRHNYKGEWIYYGICFVYYGVPYISSILLYTYFYNKTKILQSKHFWISVLTILFSLTINESFNFHRAFVNNHFDIQIQHYVRACVTNFFSVSLYLIPIFIYWIIYDKKYQNFYGLNSQFNVKPYLIMILIMSVPIIWASFQADFLQMYPIYSGKGIEAQLGFTKFQAIGLFETLYSLDFIAVEIVFRGFMILALGKFIGKGAIIPMVTLYCVFHFGKPLGETISSIFGGFILGVLAYETRSVYGGIIIHVGIALMMEFAAMLQKGF